MMIGAVLAVLLSFGAPKETAGDVATAIAKYARTPSEAAFHHCHRWECDHGLAIGAWQLHRGAAGPDWARLPGDLELQAKHAAGLARWAMRACPKDPVRGGFRVLGGLGCDRTLKGEEKRIAAFNKARAAL